MMIKTCGGDRPHTVHEPSVTTVTDSHATVTGVGNAQVIAVAPSTTNDGANGDRCDHCDRHKRSRPRAARRATRLPACLTAAEAGARPAPSHRGTHIKNTVTVQQGLTGGIGWGLTSGVRPARLGRRVVATAIGRADD